MPTAPALSRKTARIRTLVISAQPLVLAELRHFLALWSDLSLLGGKCDSKQTANELIKKLRPDVLLLDGTASGSGCLERLTEIHAAYPRLPIVLLAAQDSRTYALQAFRSGAAGYVLSMSGEAHVIQAIRDVYAGQFYFCPRIRQLFLCHAR